MALPVGYQTGSVILLLILILLYRDHFVSSEFFYEHCFLDVPFTLKLSSVSVSLGQPWDCSQVLACVFTDTYWYQKPTFSHQTLGWVKG